MSVCLYQHFSATRRECEPAWSRILAASWVPAGTCGEGDWESRGLGAVLRVALPWKSVSVTLGAGGTEEKRMYQFVKSLETSIQIYSWRYEELLGLPLQSVSKGQWEYLHSQQAVGEGPWGSADVFPPQRMDVPGNRKHSPPGHPRVTRRLLWSIIQEMREAEGIFCLYTASLNICISSSPCFLHL